MRGTAEATRLFTMSIADLLDEWFESPEVKGVLAINGVIGTWAGPEEPGTAYVMMHHTIGDVGDGQLGSWGYPIGGMGAVSDAIRRSAESFGADGAHRRRRSSASTSPTARCAVSTTADGREFRAPIVVAATHPQITFLRQIDRAELPDDFVDDIERWRSRTGTVKVNVALSELPDFTRLAGHRAARALHRRDRAVPLDRLPRAGVPGRPRGPGGGPPVLRRRHPVDARPRRCAPRART